MLFNKKAVSELTSFVLVTFIVIVASSSAYVFSKDALEEKTWELDKIAIEQFFKKNDYLFSQLTTFDGISSSIAVSFRTGILKFQGNKIIYTSLLSTQETTEFCYDNYCYSGSGGTLSFSLNLTSPYNFSSNITLDPDVYVVTYTHNKNVSTIGVSIR